MIKILPNGLRFLALKGAASGCVSVNVFYAVGSGDEEPGRSGLAHFLEHLNFKSTEDFAAGEFDRRARELGASNNACTSEDYTHYYALAPRSACGQICQMYASMMNALAFTSEEFETEKLVVLEEERLGDNEPFSRLWREIHELAFGGGAEQGGEWPNALAPTTIGRASEVQALSREQVMEFYRRHYGPQNALVVLAGDVSESEINAAISAFSRGGERAEEGGEAVEIDCDVMQTLERIYKENARANNQINLIDDKNLKNFKNYVQKCSETTQNLIKNLKILDIPGRANGRLRSRAGAKFISKNFAELQAEIFAIAWKIPAQSVIAAQDFACWLNATFASPVQAKFVRSARASDVEFFVHESRHEPWLMAFGSSAGEDAAALAREIASEVKAAAKCCDVALCERFSRLEAAKILCSSASLAELIGTAWAAGDIAQALRKICTNVDEMGIKNATNWLKDEIIAVLKA